MEVEGRSSRRSALIWPSLDCTSYKRVQFSRSDRRATNVFIVLRKNRVRVRKILGNRNCRNNKRRILGTSYSTRYYLAESKKMVHFLCTRSQGRKVLSYSKIFDHRGSPSGRIVVEKKSRTFEIRGRIGKRGGEALARHRHWQVAANRSLSGIDRSVVDASPRLPARSEVIRSISVALCLV